MHKDFLKSPQQGNWVKKVELQTEICWMLFKVGCWAAWVSNCLCVEISLFFFFSFCQTESKLYIISSRWIRWKYSLPMDVIWYTLTQACPTCCPWATCSLEHLVVQFDLCCHCHSNSSSLLNGPAPGAHLSLNNQNIYVLLTLPQLRPGQDKGSV